MPTPTTTTDPPITAIPDNTLWISVRGKHPDQVVRVLRTNAHAVFITVERPGKSQSSNTKKHRWPRSFFLEHYKPYHRADWEAATVPVEKPSPEPERGVSPMTWTYTLTAEPEPPEPTQPTPEQPVTETKPAPAIGPRYGHRWQDITDPQEIKDIVELWRSEIPIQEIAKAYKLIPSHVFGLVARNVSEEEYGLRSVVDYLKRIKGGPVRPFRLSQMTTAKDGALVERVIQRGAKEGKLKVWEEGKYKWVALPDKPAAPTAAPTFEPPVVEVEPVAVAPSPPAPPPAQAAPVAAPVAQGQARRFRVTIRRVVIEEQQVTVEAENVIKAAQIASEGLQPNEEVWTISAGD